MDPITPTSLTSPELTGRAAPRLEQPPPADMQGAKLRKLKKATSDFEALFLTHLLKPLEKSLSQSSGGQSLGGDVMFGVAITKMAESIAQKGGLGLGDVLYRSMEPKVLAELNPPPENSGSIEDANHDAEPIPLGEPAREPMPLPDSSKAIPLSGGLTPQSSDKKE